VSTCDRPLRIGIATDGLLERVVDGCAEIANGGVGVYIDNLVRHLLAVDPVNEYFLLRADVGRLDLYRHERVRAVFGSAHRFTGAAPVLGWTHRAAVAQYGLDLLHYPNQFGGAFLPLSIPRVVTLHDLTPLLFPAFHPWHRVAAFRLLLRRALARAQHVIVDASHTKRDLVQRGLAAEEDVSVIPLGVSDAFTAAVTTSAPARDDLPARYVLTVGVLEPRKNHVALLRAVRRLHAQGDPISVVMVGRDGWNWQDPLQSAELSALRPWVRILRNVSEADLVALYRRATVFAYPSLYEGFGLPLLEAMACGVPVVASNRSALPEVAGEAALLVDPSNAEAIAAALTATLHDSGLRQRLIAAGLERARMFSWQRTAERTLAVYRQVAHSAARSR
jgi:glycosyltransferase involved in cell wall biosynthesis